MLQNKTQVIRFKIKIDLFLSCFGLYYIIILLFYFTFILWRDKMSVRVSSAQCIVHTHLRKMDCFYYCPKLFDNLVAISKVIKKLECRQ